MALSKLERRLLMNQYTIMGMLDETDKGFYEKMHETLEYGFSDFYEYYLFGSMSGEMSSEDGTFVMDAFEVHECMQRSYEKLEDKGRIEERRLAFPGFDGNNEGAYMAYARFLREKEDRFTEVTLGFDSLNSHAPRVDKYGRMIEEWKRVSEDRRYESLTKDEILSILGA